MDNKNSQSNMKADTDLLPSEPLTHAEGTKTCSQRLGCQQYHLTQEQLHKFHSLKREANILFEDQERWDLIHSLYSQYFQLPPQRTGKEWMRLGFQGKSPETDFRGGGVLSLQVILRFVKKNRALVQIMEQDKAGFFFAITAINIAFYLKKYFHLADFLVPGKDQQTYCNRKALKNFCRLLTDNEQTYYEVHEILLKDFYNNLWMPAQRDNGQTLLQFNKLFNRLTSKLRHTFENNTLHSLRDFFAIYGGS